MQAEIESKKGYLDAATTKKYGEMYKGGEAAFLKDQAEYRLSRTAGLLQEIRDHGVTPERVSQLLGELEGIRNLTDAEVFRTVGERGVYITRAGEQFNEASKFLLRKWLDEVGTHGYAQGTTREMLKAIHSHPTGRAQLRAQGVKASTVVSPEQAFNFGQAFRKAGANVTNSDLSGATVDASLYFDKDGTPRISMLATKKGQRIAEINEGEKAGGPFNVKVGTYTIPRVSGRQRIQGNRIETTANMEPWQLAGLWAALKEQGHYSAANKVADLIKNHKSADVHLVTDTEGKILRASVSNETLVSDKETIGTGTVEPDWSGSFAGQNFISAQKTTFPNGRVIIEGLAEGDNGCLHLVKGAGYVDEQGHEHFTSFKSQEGPDYQGAFISALEGNVPTEALRNPMYGRAFAKQYAAEIKPWFKGELSKQYVYQVTENLGGSLDGKLGGPGIRAAISEAQTRFQKATTGEDAVVIFAQSILESNLTGAQKQRVLREFTQSLTSLKETTGRTAGDLKTIPEVERQLQVLKAQSQMQAEMSEQEFKQRVERLEQEDKPLRGDGIPW